jgi:fatty acid desaturase
MLRRDADRRALLWMSVAVAVAAGSWCFPPARPWLLPLGIYFSFSAGLIAHAHNHCPMFHSRAANQLFNLLLTPFFGFPVFVWVAGHNRQHHKFTNGPGDPSAGWRLFHGHHLVSAIVTPLFVMVYEPVVGPFLVDAWRRRRRLFVMYLLQLAVYAALGAAALAADWRGFVWAFVLPGGFGLYALHYVNYIQHVHCDPSSEFAHSRDWTGRLVNFFTFNQGFHTVHHNRPGAHWSEWRTLHEEVRGRVPAELQSDNLFWWMVRQYFLAPLEPTLGTRQLGTPPWQASAPLASTLETPGMVDEHLW